MTGRAAMAAVVISTAHLGAPPAAAAVLTGFTLAGPLPAALAFLLRPHVLSPVWNAAIGTAVLLLVALPAMVFPACTFGPSLLVSRVK